MTWTTPQDIIERWIGNDVPQSTDLLEVLIGDAESVVLSEYPKIQDRIDASELQVSTVVMVVSRMVSRLLRNPEMVGYVQQTTGPFSQALNFGSNIDIWMTENEKQLLAPSSRRKAFTTDLGADAISPYDSLAAYHADQLWVKGN